MKTSFPFEMLPWCFLALLLGGCASTPKPDWNSRVGSFAYDQAVARWGRLTNLPSYRMDRLLPNGSSGTVPAFRSEWALDSIVVVAAASGLAKQLKRRPRANSSD